MVEGGGGSDDDNCNNDASSKKYIFTGRKQALASECND